MKELNRKVLRALGELLLGFSVNMLCKSLRLELINYTKVNSMLEDKQNLIVAFWHGTMLVPWYLFRGKGLAGLVSKSKDGELLNQVLEKWNYKVIRGSSRDGGKEALNTMVELANNGNSLAVTPDGPTGPMHKMKAGAVITAQRTGLPLVLLGTVYNKSYNLKSWDRFEIPKPFSKVKCVFSDPIYFDSELTREQISAELLNCESLLNKIQYEATN